ncbi:MAG: hypothetical protein ACRDSJ_07290 [Rubrobacteraceae bacterium]
MRKLFKGLVFLGIAAGVAVAVKNYLEGKEAPGEESVQITFDDGSTKGLASNTIEGQEFTDIARKLIETGL